MRKPGPKGKHNILVTNDHEGVKDFKLPQQLEELHFLEFDFKDGKPLDWYDEGFYFPGALVPKKKTLLDYYKRYLDIRCVLQGRIRQLSRASMPFV